MSTLSDLIKGVTQPEYFKDLMDRHRANGVPIDSWLSTTNVGLALTEETSQLLASLREDISFLAAAMFLQYATGDGLTLFSKSQYQNDRLPASPTEGIMRLLSAVSAPTYNIAVGQLIVGSSSDPAITFTNITGGTLLPNSFLDLQFRATEAGTKFNLSNSQPIVFKTALPGVSISNPIYPLSVTWITKQGTNEESDESLIQRNISRWGTIGAECNTQALIYFATLPPSGYTTSPVKYVRVLSNFISNTTVTGYWPGCVTIVLGNDLGPLAPADKLAVEANFENPQKYGIGRQIYYQDMTFLNATISGTVYIYKESGASPDLIKQQVEDSLADFQSFIQIGEVITLQKIGARMEDANKVAIKQVVLTSPIGTLSPSYTQKVRFIIGSILYVSV